MSGARLSTEELTERTVGALERRDLDAFLALVSPEAEFVPLLAGVDGGVYRGHDAVRRWLSSLWDAWAGYHPKVVSTEELDSDVAIVELLIRLRGHASDIEIETTAFGVSTRDPEAGLITSWRFFAALPEARVAAAEIVRTRSQAR